MGHFHQIHTIYYGLPLNLITIGMGLLVLTLGRKLFWLFVGAVGFTAGFYISSYAFYGQPLWIMLLIGFIAGIAGSIFALFLQRFAVILGGFLAGGYLVLNLVFMWGWHMGRFPWILFLIGGIIGAIVAALFFDWALIVLSSLTGATMITRTLPLNPAPSVLIFVVLMALGLFIQAGMFKYKPETKFVGSRKINR